MAISYLEDEETDAHRIIGLINDAGRKALPLPGDLTDPSYCRNLVAQAVEGLGGLDILVNNGGRADPCRRPGRADRRAVRP